MQILLIEDEEHVSSFISKGLKEQGHVVTQAYDGESGLKLATQNDYNIIILDVIMPKMTGLEVCEKLKTHFGINTPVLMLTALSTTDDIVCGLNTGADDYLSKPFKFKELLARVNVLLRSSTRNIVVGSDVLETKDLQMNVKSKEVTRNGKEIPLTAREFRLLEYLLLNKNIVVSRIAILESVWEVDFDLGTNVIDVYINYLRKKIEVGFSDKIITTVTGMGYVIKE